MKQPVVVLDNGAYNIKVGVVNLAGAHDVRVFPNAVITSKGDKATYVGPEIERCRDFAGLHYRLPFEKGYLVDWDAQKAIWDGVFTKNYLGVEPGKASLLITEPYFNLPDIQTTYDEFVFEEYAFASYARAPPAALVPHGSLFRVRGTPPPECAIVVDAGFSFTHVVPILKGAIVWPAVRRIDVGGKLLTNHLKELVSYRQWNMMEETYIMNEVKEKCCFVSQDFAADLETCRKDPKRNPIVQEYVLPDYSTTHKRGHVRARTSPSDNNDAAADESDQILYMGNERFSVPEILFRPDDLGLNQSGLATTVAHAIDALPQDLSAMFWANIGLVGGCAKFPGFADRLMKELRPLAPSSCEVKIYESKDAVLEVYRSAASLAKLAAFHSPPRKAGDGNASPLVTAVTRQEYQESGPNACRRAFGRGCWKAGHEAEIARFSKGAQAGTGA